MLKTRPLQTVPHVVYERFDSGTLTRVHRRVSMTPDERASAYPYREPLQGWPETEVFWTSETGPGVGVAPTAD